ncbi:HDGF like 2, partial [Homo sapiens]
AESEQGWDGEGEGRGEAGRGGAGRGGGPPGEGGGQAQHRSVREGPDLDRPGSDRQERERARGDSEALDEES